VPVGVKEKRFEYKFVRIGEGRTSAIFGVQGRARTTYEQVVHEHAHEGWRLVQIFAPGVASFGAAKYFELIFEREQAEEEERVEDIRDRDRDLARV
jgi:hypothetical protein